MNTDEYEISIGREVDLCRRLIKILYREIHIFENRYGMDTETFLRNLEVEIQSGNEEDLLNWKKARQELQFWKKMLHEYESALSQLGEQ